jgi:hypothetical protein
MLHRAAYRNALRDLFARSGPMAEKQNQGIQNQKRVHQCFASFALLAGRGHGRDGLNSAPSLARCLTRRGAQTGFSLRMHRFFRGIVPGGGASATCAATSLLRNSARRYRAGAFVLQSSQRSARSVS